MDRGAILLNILSTMRNGSLDQLAASMADLHVAQARIAELEAKVRELTPPSPDLPPEAAPPA